MGYAILGDFMESYWIDSTKQLTFSRLDKNINTTVCIIGGGITGVTTRIFTF